MNFIVINEHILNLENLIYASIEHYRVMKPDRTEIEKFYLNLEITNGDLNIYFDKLSDAQDILTKITEFLKPKKIFGFKPENVNFSRSKCR